MSPSAPRSLDAADAIRRLERYHDEVVERFGLCPWAKHARAAGRTRVHVVVSPEPGDTIGEVVRSWVADDAIDVAFVIAPWFTDGFEALEVWGHTLRSMSEDAFFVAAFHPGAPPTAGTVRFFRQTPDPTIQLIRRTRLEEVRAADPSHYQDIFTLTLDDLQRPPAASIATTVLAHNESTLTREGRPTIQTILDNIQADKRGQSPFTKG
ncbi:MAG: hypothetical protein WBG86_06430 [Polyangiales bacterium]